MAKEMTYNEQLQDPRWRELREIILERDLHVCQNCLSGKVLQVHHKYYLEGKMAWEYPHDALVTLCRKCHAHEHGIGHAETYERTFAEYGSCRPVRTIREIMIDAIRQQIDMLNKKYPKRST